MRKLVPIIVLLFTLIPRSLAAGVLFTTEYLYNKEAKTLILNNDAGSPSSSTLQFGTISPQTLKWDIANARFNLSSNLFVNGSISAGGNIITLDQDNTGTPQNVQIIAHQGTSPDGILRYNASTQKWEMSSNGGVLFEEIATKGISLVSPPTSDPHFYSSIFSEEFNKKINDITSDTKGANQTGMGDGGGWGVYESKNNGCMFSTPDDTINGILSIKADTVDTGCLTMIDDGLRDPRMMINIANLHSIVMKVLPTNVGATNIVFAGIGNESDGVTTSPSNFIGFTNNGGNTWTGRTTLNGVSTNVCQGQIISTTKPAILKVEVITNSTVNFYVDTDTSDGINPVLCGTSVANIPTINLAPQFEYQSRTGGTAPAELKVDYFRMYSN